MLCGCQNFSPDLQDYLSPAVNIWTEGSVQNAEDHDKSIFGGTSLSEWVTSYDPEAQEPSQTMILNPCCKRPLRSSLISFYVQHNAISCYWGRKEGPQLFQVSYLSVSSTEVKNRMESLGHALLLVIPEKGKQKCALGLRLLAMGGCQKCTICVFSLGRSRVLLTLDTTRAALGNPPIRITDEH